MSNKIVSSGASGKRGFSGTSGGGGGQSALTEHYIGFGDSSNLLTGSSNLQWNDSTRIMSLTGDEDIEATIQCGRKLTIQSSQDMNVSGLIVNVTSGSGNVEITSANNLNLTTQSGDCTLDINGSINLYAENGSVIIEALNNNNNEIALLVTSGRMSLKSVNDDDHVDILMNSYTINTIHTGSSTSSLIIQNATKKLGFFDNAGITQKTVSLNSDLTLTGLQSSLNALITALGNTSGSGYGLIAN
jgi:hypothetical protein